MTTTTTERPVPAAGVRQSSTWVCENCRAETSAVRKRCGECGTSRY
jgi:hypothetical protein